jgi:pilus assembly protein CpaB
MNTARVAVLAIAVCAGGVAAYLASRPDPQPVVVQAPVIKADTTDVLVAKSDIPMGQTVTTEDLQWQSWPSSTASSSFILKNSRANAVTELTGSIARSPFLAGEPIRETKLVKGNGSGFMAAILPSGMLAISTEISPETGAGGFILPNDRVDVLMTRRQKNPDSNGPDIIQSDIVLRDVRVLAIDQTVEEKNGQKVVVGRTATLELKPRDAETLTRSRQGGTLTLGLRSLVDANKARKPDTPDDSESLVTVYRGMDRDIYNCTDRCKKRGGEGG